MSDNMKAAVVSAFGEPLSVEEVALPQPGHYEALVKVQ